MNRSPEPTDPAGAAPEHQYLVMYDDLEEVVCWRLIERAFVGRVGFVFDGEPFVLPVNCAVVDGKIVFRTAEDSMLHSLGDRARVAFEVDHVDPVAESGWSVLVRGNISEVVDKKFLGRLVGGSNHPWAPGPIHRWMVIVPSVVSGRSITRHE